MLFYKIYYIDFSQHSNLMFNLKLMFFGCQLISITERLNELDVNFSHFLMDLIIMKHLHRSEVFSRIKYFNINSDSFYYFYFVPSDHCSNKLIKQVFQREELVQPGCIPNSKAIIPPTQYKLA